MLDAVTEQKIVVDFNLIKEELIRKAWISIHDMNKKREVNAVIRGNELVYNGVIVVPFINMDYDYYKDGTFHSWSCYRVGFYVQSPDDFVNLIEEMRKVKSMKNEKAIYAKSILYQNKECLSMNNLELHLESAFYAMISEIDSLRSGECANTFETMKKDLQKKSLSVESFMEKLNEYKFE